MGSSNEKSHSTSTVLGGQPTSKPSDDVLLKIKDKVFYVDLLQLLESDTSVSFSIKYLLKQVNVVDVAPKVVEVIMN